MAEFEVSIGTLHGHLTSVVSDPHGVSPTTVINLNHDWHLTVDWQLHGPAVPMIAGNWRVQAYLESMGPGPEIPVVSDTVSIASGGTADPFGLSYHRDYIIGPNTPAEEGVYKLVTVITSESPSGTPGPFAAFEEGPLLQFYRGI
jgi:hypothetical protein